MKQSIKRKLQEEGKWDYTNDCPITETELPQKSWKPVFLCEGMVKEKYEILKYLNENHHLLRAGNIVDGHFKFTLSAYDDLGIQKDERFSHPTPKCVSTYILRLKEAIKDANGGMYKGKSLENDVKGKGR